VNGTAKHDGKAAEENAHHRHGDECDERRQLDRAPHEVRVDDIALELTHADEHADEWADDRDDSARLTKPPASGQ
jgi:hypothetical protein